MTGIRALLMCCLVVGLAACGYHNPYTRVDKDLAGVVKINDKMWTNNTNELGLEARIHLAISDWLQESKHIHLITTNNGADYQLSGEVIKVDYPGYSYTTFDQASTLKAAVTVRYSFTNNKTASVVWTDSLTKEISFAVGADAVRTQSNKQITLNTIADELAEQIYMRVFYTLSREMKRADRKNLTNKIVIDNHDGIVKSKD